jgi:glycosyltransferase involved in cell wall biosynthesis
MHVAMVNLTSGGMSRGYRKYLTSLVPLLRQDPALRLDVYVPPSLLGPLAAEGLGDLLAWPEGDERRGFAHLRQELRGRGPDVVFIPTARFIDTGRPCVVMVRNMEPLERPFGGNTLAAGLRNLARARTARRACRRATRVIAVSQHVADFLARRWGLDPRKIGVVYHGVDPAPHPLPSDRPEALASVEVGRFLFAAGSIRPARGLEDVIRALRLLGPGAPPLAIAGRPDPDSRPYARRLLHLAEREGVAEQIVWAGGLDRVAMDWAYAHCACFLMTSRSEACPNTVLEAMSHGCLSISVERPPMTELFADTATYYREADAAGLAQRLTGLLRLSLSERAARSQQTRDRASRFTWQSTAQRTRTELRLQAPGTSG